ncbi:MAG TPA: type II toxin-antitoxin system VapC family toxin [Spirochaetia bacterium]|nr:type II toxin-antitoxin system VapC family toxin [Spirochaetia bacterium]
MILIDTDICIEILHKNEEVISRRAGYDDEVAVSFMSIAELYYGSAKSSDPAGNNSLIEEFLLTVAILHTDLSILRRFGELKNSLRNQGHMLPDADIFIAATTYEKADLLATGNAGHFKRFSNLSVANWIR